MLTPFTTKSYNIDRRAYARMMMWRNMPSHVLKGLALAAGFSAVSFVFWGMEIALRVAAGALVFIALVFAGRRANVERITRDEKSRHVYETMRTIRFDEAGAFVNTESGIESTIPWSGFISAEQRGAFLLLFMSAIQHLIVTDDAFPTLQDREALSSLLRDRGLLAGKTTGRL